MREKEKDRETDRESESETQRAASVYRGKRPVSTYADVYKRPLFTYTEVRGLFLRMLTYAL